MEPARCGCGAALAEGALACSLCHAPVGPVPGGPPGLTARLDERVFSRSTAGPLSFGPVGRLVISLMLMAPIWFMWFMSGGGLANLVFVLPTALLPLWYLRETWRSHRVR